MIEKLETKIDEVLEYIISKPVEEITANDFSILAGELRERRFQSVQCERNKQSFDMLNGFMASINSSNSRP